MLEMYSMTFSSFTRNSNELELERRFTATVLPSCGGSPHYRSEVNVVQCWDVLPCILTDILLRFTLTSVRIKSSLGVLSWMVAASKAIVCPSLYDNIQSLKSTSAGDPVVTPTTSDPFQLTSSWRCSDTTNVSSKLRGRLEKTVAKLYVFFGLQRLAPA